MGGEVRISVTEGDAMMLARLGLTGKDQQRRHDTHSSMHYGGLLERGNPLPAREGIRQTCHYVDHNLARLADIAVLLFVLRVSRAAKAR